MISILIVSHGNLAAAMLNSAELIVGHQQNAAALCFDVSQAPEVFKDQLQDELEHRKDGDILLFSDIRSGTPFNVAGSLMQEYDFRHISGVNLALLIEALTLRNELDIDALCAELMDVSGLTILDVNALMAQEDL